MKGIKLVMEKKRYHIQLDTSGKISKLFQIDGFVWKGVEPWAYGKMIYSKNIRDYSKNEIYIQRGNTRTKCQLLDYIFGS